MKTNLKDMDVNQLLSLVDKEVYLEVISDFEKADELKREIERLGVTEKYIKERLNSSNSNVYLDKEASVTSTFNKVEYKYQIEKYNEKIKTYTKELEELKEINSDNSKNMQDIEEQKSTIEEEVQSILGKGITADTKEEQESIKLRLEELIKDRSYQETKLEECNCKVESDKQKINESEEKILNIYQKKEEVKKLLEELDLKEKQNFIDAGKVREDYEQLKQINKDKEQLYEEYEELTYKPENLKKAIYEKLIKEKGKKEDTIEDDVTNIEIKDDGVQPELNVDNLAIYQKPKKSVLINKNIFKNSLVVGLRLALIKFRTSALKRTKEWFKSIQKKQEEKRLRRIEELTLISEELKAERNRRKQEKINDKNNKLKEKLQKNNEKIKSL